MYRMTGLSRFGKDAHIECLALFISVSGSAAEVNPNELSHAHELQVQNVSNDNLSDPERHVAIVQFPVYASPHKNPSVTQPVTTASQPFLSGALPSVSRVWLAVLTSGTCRQADGILFDLCNLFEGIRGNTATAGPTGHSVAALDDGLWENYYSPSE
ncbi:hypothetical protein BaRGS_00023773 [Batillaria attramentaria]|uniref:Uncharacterized protein n=1 Tax=Batillaria attramentaria TaxID=370345 RepID=A0ABD0KD15_9CAEN